MRNNFVVLFAAMLAIVSVGCKRNAHWQLKGEIEGAPDATVLLESSFNGRWFALDSTKTDKGGRFEFKQPAAKYPSIFRLSYNGEQAYFPVDSADNVTFTASASDFGHNYQLGGTVSAQALARANDIISSTNGTSLDENAKRELTEIILSEPDGVVAHYIINSTTPGGQRVFSPANKKDLRVIGAVANAYTERRPGDPRTEYLKNLYLGSRKETMMATGVATDTLVANEISFPEIVLMDNNGVEKRLSDAVAQGPVLLNFTTYGSEYSPALNIELNEVYSRYNPKGLQIYQVALDADEFQWRQIAKTLPWITVYNSPKNGAEYIITYNVGQLPTTFLINSKGELVERIVDHSEISTIVGKHL